MAVQDFVESRARLSVVVSFALALGLFLGGCGETAAPTDKGHSPASSDDDEDEEKDDEEDTETPPAKLKDAGGTTKVDAGTKPPAIDAGTKTTDEAPVKDAGSSVSKADTGTAVDDGGGAKGDGSVEPETAHEDLGKGDGKDVITIGDSWMNYIVNGGGIERGLLAASGQPYRTYGVAGTKLLDEVIPRQYASAKRANPDIKTVVMTGGGNDLLLSPGADPKPTIDKIGVRLDALWTEMGKDGVKDVVYIEYSEGGTNADQVQYGIEKVSPICKNHKGVRCHFMLSDPIINKQLLDGVHPTQDGCTKLGKAAFDLMVAEKMRR